jgi:hypothetical protein
MRRSFDSLYAVTREELGQAPMGGRLLVFIDRRATQVKVRDWNRTPRSSRNNLLLLCHVHSRTLASIACRRFCSFRRTGFRQYASTYQSCLAKS